MSTLYCTEVVLVYYCRITFERIIIIIIIKILLVLRICPIQSGSLVLVGRAKSLVQQRTTAVKQVHLVQRKSTGGRSPATTLESKGATEGAGSKKVETNDGTTKFGLPCIWLAAPAIEAKTGGKPTPETAKGDA